MLRIWLWIQEWSKDQRQIKQIVNFQDHRKNAEEIKIQRKNEQNKKEIIVGCLKR